MIHSVAKEYKSLLTEKSGLETAIRTLPTGYISEKFIKGKNQYYLQHRQGSKVTSTYIKAADVENVRQRIELRKSHIRRMGEITDRLAILEEAAKMIGHDLYCQICMYKLSEGMDTLGSIQREKCATFGDAMNAIEGVLVSVETAGKIEEWKQGKRTYQSVFEETLRLYGFPTEARG